MLESISIINLFPQISFYQCNLGYTEYLFAYKSGIFFISDISFCFRLIRKGRYNDYDLLTEK